MPLTEIIELDVGQVEVMTTDHGGFPVEYWADRLLIKIIAASEDASPAVKHMVEKYKESIRTSVIHYMKNAIKSENTNIYNVLFEAGHIEAANLIRRR